MGFGTVWPIRSWGGVFLGVRSWGIDISLFFYGSEIPIFCFWSVSNRSFGGGDMSIGSCMGIGVCFVVVCI